MSPNLVYFNSHRYYKETISSMVEVAHVTVLFISASEGGKLNKSLCLVPPGSTCLQRSEEGEANRGGRSLTNATTVDNWQ